MRAASLVGLLGLVAATALFAWQGFGGVLHIVATAGFGVIVASLCHIIPMTFNARAWQILLPGKRRPSLGFFVWAVWLRESVNGLLPVARIGGEVTTAKLLTSHGLRARSAVASLVVDVTLSLISQYAFTMIGLGGLLLTGDGGSLLKPVLWGLLTVVPVVALVLVVQKIGLFTLIAQIIGALFGDKFTTLVGSASGFDLTVRRFYKRRRAIIACTVWQIIGWVSGASEIFVLLWFMGHPIPFRDAVIVESLIQALSSSAFVVPGALGVQEGGFLIIGGLVGLSHELALAVALARRARDVLLFVPALAIWQVGLARKLIKAPTKTAPTLETAP